MPVPAEPVKLTLSGEGIEDMTMALKPGEYAVGRNRACYIRFPEEYRLISPRHALIRVGEEGAAEVEDLDSEGGTMVNGRIIRRQRLEDQDLISLGDVMIRVHLPQAEPQAEAPQLRVASHLSEERARDLAERLDRVQEGTAQVMAEVQKRIYGQDRIVRAVWATLLARGHCLMVGVPGLAKTYLVNTLAEVLGIRSNRIQFTPDLMPTDILGSNVLQVSDDGRKHMEFVQGPIFTQLLLADEINRTPPKTQAALLEAMQERQVTVANRSFNLPAPFCVIATQNPIEQEGTYPLPEAQQDRFMLCLHLGYPERSKEVEILLRTTEGTIPEVETVLDGAQILNFQKTVDDIAVSEEAAVLAVDLVRKTRPGEPGAEARFATMIDWGAGPRAGQSLLRMAKALAAMEGRPAISRLDVLEMALPVMRHRISCNYRARTEGYSEDRIIRDLVAPFEEGLA